jgi:hypothetical protein
MDIEEILTSKHLILKPTAKWIALNDPRPAFRKTFNTKRFGKLQNNRMYVTLDLVKDECEQLIAANGFAPRYVRSTKGDGRIYPGFDTVGVSHAALAQLVDALRLAVDRHVQSPL